MQIIKSIKQIKKVVKEAKFHKKTIGFVPTMGDLHAGHISLMRKSRRENNLTVVSIFVNPIQFNNKKDFHTYPRPEKKDEILAKKEKVDIIFHPSIKEMYPDRFLTFIETEKITKGLCGRFRPGHFKGVTTVVGKLLNIIAPDKLYLGQKDAQQAAVLKQMARDLNFSVEVKVLSTIRESDGLALSSRNQFLSLDHKQQAKIIFKSLLMAKRKILKGQKNKASIIKLIKKIIEGNSQGRIEYIDCVRADTLDPVKNLKGKILIAVAVWFGKTRLIDNIVVSVK